MYGVPPNRRFLLALLGCAVTVNLGCTMGAKRMDENPLGCTLVIPSSVSTDTTVVLRLTMTNRGQLPLDLELATVPAYRFSATDGQGRVVWESTEGEPVQEALELRTLEPGESLSYTHTWHVRDLAGRPLPPGKYAVEGRVEINPPAACRSETAHLIVRQR